MTKTEPALLLVSAHARDFVLRAGTAVTATIMNGERAVIACLSSSECKESANQGLQGKPLDKVMKIRCGEVKSAAAERGAKVAFLNLGNYFLQESPKAGGRIVGVYRRDWSTVVLTHSFSACPPVVMWSLRGWRLKFTTLHKRSTLPSRTSTLKSTTSTPFHLNARE